jgi:NAD(P)-dependent dehydrogenase (short-subunit alcohol dehydrogenase family)
MTGPELRLADRVAVITGSASGAGRATAHRMSREGATVVIVDIDEPGARRVADEVAETGGQVLAIPTDVRVEPAVAAMVDEVVTRFGRLDILHNNAADLSDEQMHADVDPVTVDLAVWDQAMAANLRGPLLGCKYAIPVMVRAGGGVIINTASTSGLIGDTRRPAYAASKAGVISLTQTVATQYGHAGIRCVGIAPGLMLSPVALRNLSEEQRRVFRAERLIDHEGTPEDLAGVATFLASDDARYITGQTIVMDGGMLAHRPSLTLDQWLDRNAE